MESGSLSQSSATTVSAAPPPEDIVANIGAVEALEHLAGILGPCSKLAWHQAANLNPFFLTSPRTFALKLKGYGQDGSGIFVLERPLKESIVTQIRAPDGTMPFYADDGSEALSLKYGLPTSGGDMFTNLVEVFVPGRLDPIGKVEYSTLAQLFEEGTVRLTNFVTGQVFNASPAMPDPVSGFPKMEVKELGGSGSLVASCGVTHSCNTAQFAQYQTTHHGMEVLFPNEATPGTTKALMVALINSWIVHHRRRGLVVAWLGVMIGKLGSPLSIINLMPYPPERDREL